MHDREKDLRFMHDGEKEIENKQNKIILIFLTLRNIGLFLVLTFTIVLITKVSISFCIALQCMVIMHLHLMYKMPF